MYKSDYKLIVKRLALALLLFPISRIIFYFYNTTYFGELDFQSLKAFVYGGRFDLSTLLIVNILFIFLSLIPVRYKAYKTLLKITFVISNFIAFSLNIGDSEFFKFNGKKLTLDILNLGHDASEQMFQLFMYYWDLSLISIVALIFIWRFYPEEEKPFFDWKKVNIFLTPIIGIFFLIIAFVGIRGGIQMRSISAKQAFIFSDYKLGNLAINSVYTLVRSLDQESLDQVSFFKTDEEAIQVLKKTMFEKNKFKGIEGSNVVLIILESLSQEYVDEGYAPFFSEISKNGLYFSKNMANGRRSIEALPSILAGVPSIIGKPIYQSQFQTNKFIGLPKVLKDKGYDVSFFHGGKTGTMDFDSYTKSIGVDKYFGLEDYPNQDHFDGHWGIYDSYFFKFFSDYLDHTDKPFFSTIFSLSSHQPYSIPVEFYDKFPKGDLEIHESIGYIDNTLKRFFEESSDKEWFYNTLFIITADHTQKLNSKKFQNEIGKYRVPLVFYHPKLDLSELSNNKVTQHADILPSILDFLNIEMKEFLLFGKSVFSHGEGRAINYINGKFMYLSDKFFLRYQGNKFFYYDSQFVLQSKLDEGQIEDINELKALIQYTKNGMIKNKLYIQN
jgi:phosphoglycerol transferase MdoB-like AlkP superfamily enzyme